MKRKNLITSVCFALTGMYANAQQKVLVPPPPPQPPAITAAVLPPPPPAPPEPAAPPAPPAPPFEMRNSESGQDDHTEVRIIGTGNNGLVTIIKNGKKETVKLEEWNAHKAYYEKKYNVPPPPPPPPPPAPPTNI